MQTTIDRIVQLRDGRSVGYAQDGDTDGFPMSTRTAAWRAASMSRPPRRSPIRLVYTWFHPNGRYREIFEALRR